MTIAPVPRREGGTYPASYAQVAMWLADRMRPGRTTMNILIPVRLRGALDHAALTGALADLVARHEILRTVFVEVDGELRQLIHPALVVPVTDVDLRWAPAEARDRRAHEIAQAMLEEPFDLGTGPLLRTSLVRLDDDDHLLLMVWHHIIHDGWSISLVMTELRQLYARRRGLPVAALPPPALQYVDYAVWLRDRAAGGEFDAAAARRRAQLSAPRPDAVLPCVPARPDGPSRGARRFMLMETDLIRRLRQAAMPLRTTPFHVLFTGYLALLARYTGYSDLTVAVIVSGRSQPELEPLIGPFVNTMPVRLVVDEATTFRSLVTAVRPEAMRVLTDQEVPWELFGLGDDGPPLRFGCVTQERAGEPAGWPGLTEVPWFHDIDDAFWDLSLGVKPASGGVEVTLQYLTDRLDEATVDRFGVHMRNLLSAMADEPDRPVGTLPVLTGDEFRSAVHDWNPPAPAPRPGVLATIEEHARRQPDAAALVGADGTTMSYAELIGRAGRAAGALRAGGVKPGDRVGVLVDRSPDAVVAIFGIMAARAAFVPVSGEAPPARAAHQFADAGVRVALTTSDSVVPEGVRAVDLAAALLDSPESIEHPLPEDLAYVIYTSGSTGGPKGVAVSHANLATTAAAWRQVLPEPAAPVRMLQSADLGFDVFVSDLVRALCRGGTLVFCPREVLLDPPRLYALMVARQVNAAFLVPTVARLLAGHLRAAGRRLDFLDLLIFGVERMSVGEFTELAALTGPQATVLNSYGVTEATIDSTVYSGPPPVVPASTTMPIGRPLPGTRAYILDGHGQPCPVGVTGELHLGGDAVARGYVGADALTAARFAPDPFHPGAVSVASAPPAAPPASAAPAPDKPGGRLYRTGDLARYHPDGNIELVGRADLQLKIRGRRIEPGEVEAALRELPEVAECVVVAREVTPGDTQLVGYLVGDGVDVESVRTRLAGLLPGYLVPGFFVVLPALPLNTNGKLDRAALPPPDPAQATGPAYVAPRTPAEQRLAEIWARLLGAERIGVHDGFVARGGHSLIAVRLVGEVRATFGVELPLPAVFERGTVAGQAELVEELLAAELAEMSEADAVRLLESLQ